MTNNQKIGLGVLALIATYFVALKLIANAAKDEPKKEDPKTKEGFDKKIDVSKIQQNTTLGENVYTLNGGGYLVKYVEPAVNKEVYNLLSNQIGDNIPFYDATTGKILGYSFNDAATGDVKTITY
jgi:hypothetical protein